MILLVIATIAHFQHRSTDILFPLYVASLAAVGYLLCTAKAAPIMWSIRNLQNDEAILKSKFDSFANWHVFRTLFQIIAFLSLLWTLLNAA